MENYIVEKEIAFKLIDSGSGESDNFYLGLEGLLERQAERILEFSSQHKQYFFEGCLIENRFFSSKERLESSTDSCHQVYILGSLKNVEKAVGLIDVGYICPMLYDLRNYDSSVGYLNFSVDPVVYRINREINLKEVGRINDFVRKLEGDLGNGN